MARHMLLFSNIMLRLAPGNLEDWVYEWLPIRQYGTIIFFCQFAWLFSNSSQIPFGKFVLFKGVWGFLTFGTVTYVMFVSKLSSTHKHWIWWSSVHFYPWVKNVGSQCLYLSLSTQDYSVLFISEKILCQNKMQFISAENLMSPDQYPQVCNMSLTSIFGAHLFWLYYQMKIHIYFILLCSVFREIFVPSVLRREGQGNL